MMFLPERDEASVVVVPAECARAVAGRHRRGLIQEEQLGEAARLQQRTTLPPAELEPARDPTANPVPAADDAIGIVQASAVPVHEPARGVGDQLAERRDTVL